MSCIHERWRIVSRVAKAFRGDSCWMPFAEHKIGVIASQKIWANRWMHEWMSADCLPSKWKVLNWFSVFLNEIILGSADYNECIWNTCICSSFSGRPPIFKIMANFKVMNKSTRWLSIGFILSTQFVVDNFEPFSTSNIVSTLIYACDQF